MYVRWVVRHHKNATIATTVFHDAYLVESYRDERSNPRQRTLAYLGNIREIDQRFLPVERGLFLLRAENILGSMDELSAADCEAVLQLLKQKVPPLSGPEITHAFAENLRWCRQRWAQQGDGPSDEELIRMVREIHDRPGSM